MGSVIVPWKGICHDRNTQEELIGFLQQLADHSAARIGGPQPRRPAFLELMQAGQCEDSHQLDVVRFFDQEITGRIVLDPFLTLDLDRLHEETQHAKTEMVAVEADGMEKREEFCLSLSSRSAQWFLRLSRLRLYGIDFQLFDSRNLYPNSNRMSFVFLESPDLSALNGCIAQVETQAQCHLYSSEAIRSADWYVSTPQIHLRYYLEEWSDLLLSWVKYFFISNLYYWRYEELAQYDLFRDTMFETGLRHVGIDTVKQLVFQYLVERFETEASEWGDYISKIP